MPGVQLFSDKKFFLLQRVPLRASLIKDIERHGGRVIKFEHQADYVIGDHLRKDTPPGCLSYTFVEAAIKADALPDPTLHLANKGAPASPNATRPAGSYGISSSGKATRTPFTPEDDRVLRQWVEQAIAAGGRERGNEIYKELADVNSRHTFHSWRDRWLKVVSQGAPAITTIVAPARPAIPAAPATARPAPRTPVSASKAPSTAPRFVRPTALGKHPRTDAPEDEVSPRPPPAARSVADATPARSPPAATPASKYPHGFTDSDLETVLEEAHSIEKIEYSNWNDAWDAWAAHYASHSAGQWKSFYVSHVRPEYLRRKAAEEKTADPPEVIEIFSSAEASQVNRAAPVVTPVAKQPLSLSRAQQPPLVQQTPSKQASRPTPSTPRETPKAAQRPAPQQRTSPLPTSAQPPSASKIQPVSPQRSAQPQPASKQTPTKSLAPPQALSASKPQQKLVQHTTSPQPPTQNTPSQQTAGSPIFLRPPPIAATTKSTSSPSLHDAAPSLDNSGMVIQHALRLQSQVRIAEERLGAEQHARSLNITESEIPASQRSDLSIYLAHQAAAKSPSNAPGSSQSRAQTPNRRVLPWLANASTPAAPPSSARTQRTPLAVIQTTPYENSPQPARTSTSLHNSQRSKTSSQTARSAPSNGLTLTAENLARVQAQHQTRQHRRATDIAEDPEDKDQSDFATALLDLLPKPPQVQPPSSSRPARRHDTEEIPDSEDGSFASAASRVSATDGEKVAAATLGLSQTSKHSLPSPETEHDHIAATRSSKLNTPRRFHVPSLMTSSPPPVPASPTLSFEPQVTQSVELGLSEANDSQARFYTHLSSEPGELPFEIYEQQSQAPSETESQIKMEKEWDTQETGLPAIDDISVGEDSGTFNHRRQSDYLKHDDRSPSPIPSEGPDDVESYIDNMVAAGYKERHILTALEAVSMQPRLAETALKSLSKGRGLPTAISGIWTPQDDLDLESEDEVRVTAVITKHGRRGVMSRLEFLKQFHD